MSGRIRKALAALLRKRKREKQRAKVAPFGSVARRKQLHENQFESTQTGKRRHKSKNTVTRADTHSYIPEVIYNHKREVRARLLQRNAARGKLCR